MIPATGRGGRDNRMIPVIRARVQVHVAHARVRAKRQAAMAIRHHPAGIRRHRVQPQQGIDTVAVVVMVTGPV